MFDQVRSTLLLTGLGFVQKGAKLPGIFSIALIGSLVSPKPDPKDIDLLVTLSDEMDLAPLATLGRKLLEKAQSINV